MSTESIIGMGGPPLYERNYYYYSKHRVCNYRASNTLIGQSFYIYVVCQRKMQDRNTDIRYCLNYAVVRMSN